VARAIRICFKKADFRSPYVKILANTEVLAPFSPWLTEKSVLLKIFDLKASGFRGVSVSSFLPTGSRLSKKKERKTPKYAALRQVRITRV